MFLYRCHILALLTGCVLVRSVSVRKCRPDACKDDQVCCVQGNNASSVPCCKELTDKTYHNIAMVTRKLSGVLIMLLLFAVGYFVQRMLCSRSRQRTPARGGQQPAITASQEPLVEICTPSGSGTAACSVQLPTYDACERLPTYEETVRDHGSGGRPEPPAGQAT